MNWVGYNRAPRRMEANFLIYSAAMTGRGDKECLDLDTFRYSIGARELPAA